MNEKATKLRLVELAALGRREPLKREWLSAMRSGTGIAEWLHNDENGRYITNTLARLEGVTYRDLYVMAKGGA